MYEFRNCMYIFLLKFLIFKLSRLNFRWFKKNHILKTFCSLRTLKFIFFMHFLQKDWKKPENLIELASRTNKGRHRRVAGMQNKKATGHLPHGAKRRLPSVVRGDEVESRRQEFLRPSCWKVVVFKVQSVRPSSKETKG